MTIKLKHSSDLTLDEDTHTYYRDGRIVPGLTEIMEAGGLYGYMNMIPKRILENARVRGNLVHEAIENFTQGRIKSPSQVNPVARPRFEQFLAFSKQYDLDMLFCEEIMYYADQIKGDVACKVDLVARLGGVVDNGIYVVEVKTSEYQRRISSVQTSVQRAAFCQNSEIGEPVKRAVLELYDNKYWFGIHPQSDLFIDMQCFWGCYDIYRWRNSGQLL